MNVTATIETITPQYATTELAEQERRIAKGDYRQRNFNEETARRYSVDMKHGHWVLNNQGIGFDESGNLYDGRHRLWGVKMAGVAVKMLVLRGVPAQSQSNGLAVNTIDTVDNGRVRYPAQQLAIDGVVNANATAAAARSIIIASIGFGGVRLSVTQIRCVLQIYGPHIRKIISGLHSNPRLTRGYLLGVLAMYRAFNAPGADSFATLYATMVNLPSGSPVIALSKYLLNNRNIGSVGSNNAIRAVALAVHHFEKKQKITALRRTNIGVDWLLSQQKNNVRKVCEIVGFE